MNDTLTANSLQEAEILTREREILLAAQQFVEGTPGAELSALTLAFNEAAQGMNVDCSTAYCQINSELILRQAQANVRLHCALARKHAFMDASEHTDPRALARIETIMNQQHETTEDLLDYALSVIAASSDNWLDAQVAKDSTDFLRSLLLELDDNTALEAPAIPKRAEKRFRMLIGYNTEIATAAKSIAALTLLEIKTDIGAYAGHPEEYKNADTAFMRPTQYMNHALTSLLARLQAYQQEAKRAEMENILLADHIKPASTPGAQAVLH